MIIHPCYSLETWCVRESTLDLDVLAQSESVFALANGHLGLRGNLDEGEPYGLPGTYLNGYHELRPLPYAEAGYGYPEAGQTILTIGRDKSLYLNAKPVQEGEVARRLNDLLENKTEKIVLIKADEEVEYGAVMAAMDQLRQAGIEDIGLITDPKKKPSQAGGGGQ